MKLKAFLAGAAICISCMFVISCSKGKETKEVHVKSVTLNEESIELTEGDSFTLTATVLPDNASDKSVIWSSNNEAAASVSEEGVVTGVAEGDAVIKATAKDNGVFGSCSVKVNKRIFPVTGISLNIKSVPIKIGGNYTLIPTVTPDNATDKSIKWSSSDEDVAMVSKDGKVVGVSVGDAWIKATSVQNPEVADSCEFHVTSETVAVTGIALSPANVAVEVGKTYQLTASVIPAEATNQNIRWEVSPANGSIATVSAAGLVTGVKAGDCVVTATTVDGGFSKSCNVRIDDNPITSVTFEGGSTETVRVAKGTTRTIQAVVTPSDASNKKLTWTTTNNRIASILGHSDSNLTATIQFGPNEPGEVTITAMSISGTKATQTFYVYINPTSISTSSSLTLAVGDENKLAVTFSPDQTTEKGLSFASGDTGVATVDETGLVKAVASGNTTITVTSTAVPSVTATVQVKVIAENKVSINGGEAVTYETGNLSSVFGSKTITSIAWESGILDAADLLDLKTYAKSTLTSADIRNLSFKEGDTYYYQELSTSYTMKSDELPGGLFYYFSQLESLVLPPVKAIQGYAISHTKLSSLTLPEGLETLRAWSINYNLYLTNITFPSSLRTLDAYSLNQNQLEGVLDFSQVTSIGTGAFQSSNNIEKIKLSPNLRSVGNELFSGKPSAMNEFIMDGEGVNYKVVDKWLYTKDGKTLVSVPPALVRNTSITIPDGVEILTSSLFSSYELTGATLPEGLRRINGMYAFGHFGGTEIVLPSTLEYMGTLTFGYSSTLKNVTCKAVNPPGTDTSNRSILFECSALENVYVPAESVEAYKNAIGWKYVADKIKAIPAE